MINFWSRMYLYPLYLLPALLPATSHYKVLLIGVIGLSGIAYLSTFWALKSKLFQCFKESKDGGYILYEDELCTVELEQHLITENVEAEQDLVPEEKSNNSVKVEKKEKNYHDDNSELESNSNNVKSMQNFNSELNYNSNLEQNFTAKGNSNKSEEKSNSNLFNTINSNKVNETISSNSLDFNKFDFVEIFPKIESFIFNEEKYLIVNDSIVKISPKLDYTFNEYKNGIYRYNYNLYPKNESTIPNPSFLTLFKEQCVSPLFCFQVFSSLLMIFDEYVLQSIFSTLMIVAVEAGMVFSRVATMKMFRTLEQKSVSVKRYLKGSDSSLKNDENFTDNLSFDIKGVLKSSIKGELESAEDELKNVKDGSKCIKEDSKNFKEYSKNFKSDSKQRGGQRSKRTGSETDSSAVTAEVIDSVNLRPGDHIYIDSTIEIPCDLLILEGSCAVNEAMLSGESVPLIKEVFQPSDTVFDIKTHRKNVLFAGTKIEKIEENLKCVALRTGFSTEQGSLLRQMLRSDDIKYDPEALRFILILSFIGLINTLFTYKLSKKTGYPLFIDIIVLFTNSIPFELPMEMGMSVQNAVKNLISKKVYCLEPFRITLAGKVNVCCFDKTGTLTDSELDVKKVVSEHLMTNKVLSCCNEIMIIDNKVRGDPLDLAILKYLQSTSTGCKHEIIKKFPFSSELRRQSAIATFDSLEIFAIKGAPETIEKFLIKIPEDYYKYKEYAAQGYRVVATAFKEIKKYDFSDSQFFYENQLIFTGFILFGSSLKEYSKEMCQILLNSDHKILMITGDNLLTAMSVAQQLGIPTMGIEGKDINKVLDSKEFFNYSIFARADPKHKELIMRKYKEHGYHTMMVGDGTNDVGALKAADVGVAVLGKDSAKPAKNIQRTGSLANFMSQIEESNEFLKPGDASVAAPFTVKSNSLQSIIEIIQQGRSSLVTTIQMYKILALNSITNAFFLSFIDIISIKFSEYQMVTLGILSALAFSAISNPKTLPYISKEKPQITIFNKYFILSIIGQSFVHIVTFLIVNARIEAPKPVTSFEPSVMNTVLFIISAVQTVSCFICNYIGRPFRENLYENKLLGLSLAGIVIFVINIFTNIHPELNNVLQVVDIGKYSVLVASLCIADTLLSFAVERLCFYLFVLE